MKNIFEFQRGRVSLQKQIRVAGLWNKKFNLRDLSARRVLVVGVGGGCDIISAYAIASLLRPRKPELVIYANTKHRVKESLEPVTPHVFRVPAKVIDLASRTSELYGSTLIDQSVPRGDDGCPLILCIPKKPKAQAELVTRLQEKYHFDLVLSVDTGADSIVDKAASGPEGRDKETLRVFHGFSCEKLHLALAPGCDGEIAFQDLQDAILRFEAIGKYLGCFDLTNLLPYYAQWASVIESHRTPNIILDAFAQKLERSGEEGVIVPRGIFPVIPEEWLKMGLVFERL